VSRRRRGRAPHPVLDDDDPLAGMVNLFDLAIVFAVGLIVALAAAIRDGRLTHAGLRSAPELEVQEGSRTIKYRGSQEKARGAGHRIGTAFRLPSGEVVYVPDDSAGP